nr:exocyst complex component EXO70B1-like [Tanacetum cinerariifolium]
MVLFDVQHPLILVFGILGNLVSTGVYFAPVPTFIKICKRKSTMGFESFPYVVSLFSALLWMYYSFIKEGNTFLLITVNALGSLIETVYVIIFIIYATPYGRKQTLKILSASMALCLVISLGSFYLLHGPTRALVVGWICVALSICVFASPLTIVLQIVKTKSVEFMPFTLSCFLTLSAMMWFAYGMFTKDLCVTVPNVLGFVLGMIQMSLYQYYKQKGKTKKNTAEKKLPEHIVNIKILNSEVVPVGSSRSSGSEVEEEIKTANGGEEWGEGEVVEKNKGGVKVVIDDEPCGIEVVNVKPIVLVIFPMEKTNSGKAKSRRKSKPELPKVRDTTDVTDPIDGPDESMIDFDRDQMLAEIDNLINELSNVDEKGTPHEIPHMVETFVRIMEQKIRTYNSIKSGTRFGNMPEEDEFFIISIQRLTKLKAAFSTTSKSVEQSMVLLEDEFRAILRDTTAPSEPIAKAAASDSISSNGEEDFPGYSNENILLMNTIVSAMICSGYQYECCQAYSTIRKDEINDQVKRFEFEKVNVEDVPKSKWYSLEPDITRWVNLTNHCSKILLPAERELGKMVFSDHISVFTGLFVNLIRGTLMPLLEFPNKVGTVKPKAKRLFKFLDIYESLRDLCIVADESGPTTVNLEEYGHMKAEIKSVKVNIGNSIVDMFNDLKNSIENDGNRNSVQGGAVHPLIRYVMNFLKCAFEEYRNILENIFEDYIKELVSIIELLDANLETKSGLYKDPSLRYIFLMNNNRCILQIVKGSNEMKQLMGDNWCRRVQVHGKPSRKVLKDRFKNFNSMFDDIHKTQSAWVISDEQLLSEIRVSITAVISPAYRSFVGRYKAQFDGGKSIDKYIKYQPEDIESMIETLFEGPTTVNLEEYGHMKAEIKSVKVNIGNSIVDMFNDLKNSIENDGNRNSVQGGAVHPLIRYVMNFLKCAFEEYRNILENIFEDYIKELVSIIELLDANLETKSGLYKDPSLRYIFLMNNNRCILQIVKGSNEMKQLMGDNWCRRKSSDVRNYHKSYQRETWTKLLQWLTQEGVQVHGKPSRKVLKDRFKNFNSMFDDIHKTQSAWVISDEQLLSEIRVSITAVISPAYRSFVGRYKAQFDGGKSIDKYIKYQPEDIESMIETLFEGTEKVETQLNGIQAVSTVKHTTGAFKSLLKSYKNVGLMLNIVNNISKSAFMSTFKMNDSIIWTVVRLLDPKLKTLDERGIECIFVGYAEHSKAFRFYVIDPNDSVSINSIIESRDTIFDENRYSSVSRISQRSLVNRTKDIGCSIILEDVTKEVVQQPEPELRKSKRNKTPKMDSIMEINTWVLADLPEGCKPIGCKWIFKRKVKMDVKIAFFNGDLDEDLYMNQPQGFIMLGNENKVDLTKEFLSSRFSMKDIGEADVILGIKIKHEISTLMDTNEKLMSNSSQAVSQLEYSRVIGCLMYSITCTMPDIAFDVGKLSRYTSNPGTQHWHAV